MGMGWCILFGPWVRMVLNFGTGQGGGWWIGVVDRVSVDRVLVFDLFSVLVHRAPGFGGPTG